MDVKYVLIFQNLEASFLELRQPGLGVISRSSSFEIDIVQVSSNTGVLQTVQTILERNYLRLKKFGKVIFGKLLPVIQLPSKLQMAHRPFKQ